jgi:hypothetical protein
MGNATVTATVGDFRADYVISTSSPLEDAKAYWKFDDPANWGKAEIAGSGDLVINMDLVTYQPGLYDGDGAIRGNWETSLDENQDTPNVTWINTMPGQYGDDNKQIREFTVMMDLKLLYQEVTDDPTEPQVWAPLIWNGVGSAPMGPLTTIVWRNYPDEDKNGEVRLALNTRWGTWIHLDDKPYNPATLAGNEPWVRVVFSYEYDISGGQFRLYSYVNGHPAITNSTYLYPQDDAVAHVELVQGADVYFMTRRKGDKPYKGQYDLTTLAMWDRVLTLEEVATLGAIGN